MQELSLFWFRRDLRLADNAGLHYALTSGQPVLPIFIFDTSILDKLESRDDARVGFLHQTIIQIDRELQAQGSGLLVKKGDPLEVISSIISQYNVKAVYTNRDYEPYATDRDDKIEQLLKEKQVAFYTFKDHVMFEKDEILTDTDNPYKVFTPYSKRWRRKLEQLELGTFDTERYRTNFHKIALPTMPSLEEIGFSASSIPIPSSSFNKKVISDYDSKRNFPAVKGTSRLGIHLRHGTVSVREAVQHAVEWNDTFLNELIWREFYSQILYHFPKVVDHAFKPQYERIPWKNDEEQFQRWCEGKTGYPIVDAGMRELNATGFMHNRARMITASFLTKHLLIDWRWGEAYFAAKLLDFELASNNGGWQWAAGTGTDAQPYFRVFNPQSQQEKFDPELKYIRHWVPEYGTSDYVKPIVEHKFARNRAIETYKEALA